jgi:hypothetical protein
MEVIKHVVGKICEAVLSRVTDRPFIGFFEAEMVKRDA